MNRRDFIKTSGAAAAGMLLGVRKGFAMGIPKQKDKTSAGYPARMLGKTKQRVSVIAFGGIVVMKEQQENAKKIVENAVAKGISYFDVAPSYGDAELRLGSALEPFRKDVFLACKTVHRDKAAARQELEQSLKNMRTDHFDLYQLHAISDVEKDVKAALSKDGAIQTFLEAKKEGKIRFLGFSAHSPQAALTAMREFDFDTCMYPVNFVCHYNNKFDDEVLAEAKKRNMGIIALKAMALCPWQDGEEKIYSKCWYRPIDDRELAKKAISWTLSQGAAVAIPPGHENLFNMAMELAPMCLSCSESERAELIQTAAHTKALFPQG